VKLMVTVTEREVSLEAQLAEAKAARSVAEGQLTAANTEIQSLEEQLALKGRFADEGLAEAGRVKIQLADAHTQVASLKTLVARLQRQYNHAHAMIRELHKLLGRFMGELSDEN
jgi:chromosome segregation ATPase